MRDIRGPSAKATRIVIASHPGEPACGQANHYGFNVLKGMVPEEARQKS
jgi:hypothetical protein